MMAAENIKPRQRKPLSVNPLKFAVWLFIISISMVFASFTSAYIVRKGQGNWMEFELPAVFWVNTIVLLLSSVTMHWAYLSARKDNLESVKGAMGLTTLFGAAFLLLQFYAWGVLVDHDIYFVGNPSGSFLYVFTGIHGLHLVSGLVFLIIVLVKAFRYKVHSRNMLSIEMCMTYWHFLDLLWVYLFIFLMLNH